MESHRLPGGMLTSASSMSTTRSMQSANLKLLRNILGESNRTNLETTLSDRSVNHNPTAEVTDSLDFADKYSGSFDFVTTSTRSGDHDQKLLEEETQHSIQSIQDDYSRVLRDMYPTSNPPGDPDKYSSASSSAWGQRTLLTTDFDFSTALNPSRAIPSRQQEAQFSSVSQPTGTNGSSVASWQPQILTSPLDGHGNTSGLALKAVQDELSRITGVLQERHLAVKHREEEVAMKEYQLAKLSASVHEDMEQMVHDHKMKQDRSARETERHLQEKISQLTQENRRQRKAFEQLRLTNQHLKANLEQSEAALAKCKAQLSQSNRRIKNLQEARQIAPRRPLLSSSQDSILEKKKSSSTSSQPKAKAKKPAVSRVVQADLIDGMAAVLDWAAGIQQQTSTQPNPSLRKTLLKILPGIANMLPQLHSRPMEIQLPFLHFTYFGVLSLCSAGEKSNIASTCRRIGQTLYGDDETTQASYRRTFFKSENEEIRLVCTMLILLTVSQADHLSHAFDALLSDLGGSSGKKWLLERKGLAVMNFLVSSDSKLAILNATDVLVYVTMESSTSHQFLKGLCKDSWFKQFAKLLAVPTAARSGQIATQDSNIKEKLSVILQKLSKDPHGKSLFAKWNLQYIIKDVLATYGNDHPFIGLNLRSVLLNLDQEQ